MKKSIKIILSLTIIVSALFAFKSDYAVATSLKITVIDELGNIVEGASVQLYTSDADYRAEENPVRKAELTDRKGKVTFKKLEPIIYFVNVEKGDKNNDGAGVQTDILKSGLLNKVNIVIE